MSTVADSKSIKVSLNQKVRHVLAPGCRVHVSQMASDGVTVDLNSHTLVEPLLRIAEEIEELQGRQRNSLQELQELAIEIAVDVAQRVTRTCIDRNGFGIDRLVQEVVDTLNPQETLSIQMHPDDIAGLSDAVKEHGIDGTKILFRPNAAIHRGECRAETATLCLTNNIYTHLAQIRTKLLQNLENAQTERRQIADASPLLQRFPDRRATG